jgi:membrane protease YdiL (CAAX protease family)
MHAPLHTALLLVLAPLLEEVVFRAGLHENLLRRLRSPLVANALTALAFALAHVLVRGEAAAFAVALPALLIGLVYQRWRKIWPCVLLHAAMNAVWLAV